MPGYFQAFLWNGINTDFAAFAPFARRLKSDVGGLKNKWKAAVAAPLRRC